MTLHKGDKWPSRSPVAPTDSPFVEPLRELGFEEPAIRRLLKRFNSRLLREWIDITLAARERLGEEFFRKSPAAYLTDNLKQAEAGHRTPPDWWHELRKAEERARDEQHHWRRRSEPGTDALPTKAIEPVEQLQESIMEQFRAAGQSSQQAHANARRFRQASRRRSR